MTISTHGVSSREPDLLWLTAKAWHWTVNLYNFLIFSSLLLCFECVAMAFVSCRIQGVSWNAAIAVIPFFAAFSIYNLNRKTDEDEDAINRKDRFAFTKRYEHPLYYGAILSMVTLPPYLRILRGPSTPCHINAIYSRIPVQFPPAPGPVQVPQVKGDPRGKEYHCRACLGHPPCTPAGFPDQGFDGFWDCNGFYSVFSVGIHGINDPGYQGQGR